MRPLLLALVLLLGGCLTFGPNPFDETDQDQDRDGGRSDGDASVDTPDFAECANPGNDCVANNECNPLQRCECGVCESGEWTWVWLRHDGTRWNVDGHTFTVQENRFIVSDEEVPDPFQDLQIEDPNGAEILLSGGETRGWISPRRDLMVLTSSERTEQIWAVRNGVHTVEDLPDHPMELYGLRLSEPGGETLESIQPESVDGEFKLSEGRVVIDTPSAVGGLTNDQGVGLFHLDDSSAPGVAIAVQRSTTTRTSTGDYVMSWIRSDTPASVSGAVDLSSSEVVLSDVVVAPPQFEPPSIRPDGESGGEWNGDLDGSPDATFSGIYSPGDRSPDYMIAHEEQSPGLLFFFAF